MSAVALVVNTIYQHTVYINDVALANNPTQCAVLRRYYRCTAVAGCTEDDGASQFDAAYFALYKVLINNNAEYRGSSFKRVTAPLPANMPAFSVANAGVGIAGAVAAPKQTAGLIKLNTIYTGKHNRGRQYVPFPATADVAGNGAPSAGYLIALGALATQLTTSPFIIVVAGNTASFEPVIWSPRPLSSVVPIVSFLAETHFATQRRRGDYGRVNVSPY
jgi:hypothetical protein